jgi:curved DNA-binding protein CbpA
MKPARSAVFAAMSLGEILGVSQGPNDEAINVAYHRLMKRVHPDVGGSSFFAKQLNAARELLLRQATK